MDDHRLEPVSVIRSEAVATVCDFEGQFLHAAQAHAHGPGGVGPADRAGTPEFPSIRFARRAQEIRPAADIIRVASWCASRRAAVDSFVGYVVWGTGPARMRRTGVFFGRGNAAAPNDARQLAGLRCRQ